MCGIAGATRNLLADDPQAHLDAMNEVMRHRGPDMGDSYCDEGIGLCHRRLSIIDLSEDGRQPMASGDGRYHIVFNGEIYNFSDLRAELAGKGYRFSSKTDTEVLLNAYIEWGPESLARLRGMFAYAIWDGREKKLFAARDRIGKKPFYYFCSGETFAFASEMKSLLQLPDVPREIDPTAVVDYLKYLYVPHPKTVYKSIAKLEPGHYLVFSSSALTVKKYWDIDFSSPLDQNENEIEEELIATIREAVACRMIADVPLGAFLSGGVDSSAVVALMHGLGPGKPTTCTIGFGDHRYNEAHDAKKFAEWLGTSHHEQYVKDEPAEIIRKLVWHFDEPFADSSMVPTYYVSKVARGNVAVALSGDGGDESFAGYAKYVVDHYENRVRERLPRSLLAMLDSFSGRYPSLTLMRKMQSLCSSALLTPAAGFYVTNTFVTDLRLQALLADRLGQEVKGYDPAEHLLRYYRQANGPDHLAKILYTDLKLYLPGDVLTKVDRMSMANSLEVRSPLLDHKVIELAARIPSKLKLRGKEKKYILRKTLAKTLPREILSRKKHGFEAPIGTWFRAELKTMAHEVLFGDNGMSDFFHVGEIGKLWNEHQEGRIDHGTLLWSLFVFGLWLEQPH